MKQQFLTLCETYIKRDGVNDLINWLLKEDFFTAPASTKYHGSHEGGLLEHSLNVYNCLKKSIEINGLQDTYNDESIAIAALFHDLCKINLYVKGTRNVKENGQWIQKEIYEHDERFPCGHGEKSVIILQNFIRLTADEILSIRAHMGGFDSSVRAGEYFIGKIFERCKLALLLHFADMEATYLLEKRA